MSLSCKPFKTLILLGFIDFFIRADFQFVFIYLKCALLDFYLTKG